MRIDIRIAALIVIATLAIAGTIALVIRPEASRDLLPFLSAIITALLSFFVLVKVEQTHTAVNSKMDTLLKITEKAAKVEGVLEGQKDAGPN